LTHRRIAQVVPDLLFATRINGAGAALSIRVESLTAGAAPDALRAGGFDLLIVDLTGTSDPIGMIRSLKRDPEAARVPIVAFYPHVEAALAREAREAGADQVMPRSAFVTLLPKLLSGEARSAP
jgi:DNA-binding NarL/FixJ family response regulator